MMLKPVAMKALDWLNKERAYFDPQTHDLPLDEFHATALTELALLCFLLRRQSNAYNDSVKTLVNVVETVYRRPEFHQMIYSNKHTLIAHLIIRLALTQNVFDEILPAPEFREIACQSTSHFSNQTYRALELNYLLDLNNFLHPSRRATLRDPAFLDRTLFDRFESHSDIYAATHTIFYLTDFGQRELPWLSSKKKLQASAILDHLLNLTIEIKNWDLVGELILCKKCLGFAKGKMIDAASVHLGSVQEASGVICGSHKEELRLDELSSYPTDSKKLFTRLYHRTLVGAMAGLLLDA